MKVFSIGSSCNYQNQNGRQKGVNFGAIKFLATPANYKRLERERGFNSVPLTAFINKFDLAKPLKDALERWLPEHVRDISGTVKTNGEDVLFNPREAGGLEMIFQNLSPRHGKQSLADSYKPLITAIDESINSITETLEACEAVGIK